MEVGTNALQLQLTEDLTLQSGGVVKTHIAESQPSLSDLIGLGWNPRLSFSNKFPGESNDAGPGATLREPLSHTYL